MKVAEIFADLGFKVQGADELKAFETSLTNIANAARNAALALKILARTQIPRQLAQIQKPIAAQTVKAVTTAVAQAANQVKPVIRVAVGPNGQVMSATAVPPKAPVPNIPPGVYGQNQLHGPYPPQYAPPLLSQPQQPPVSNAVLQGLKQLGMAGLKLLGLGSAVLAIKRLVSALADMVRQSMAVVFAMDKLSFQTGMSKREMKEWERVAALSDVRNEELQDSLKRLQQLSRQIRYTGEGATPFLQLGINPMESPTSILKQFAKRTRDMDNATAVYWGSLIGLSDNMVYMLRRNGDQVEKLLPHVELDDQQYQNVKGLNAAWAELSVTVGALKDKLTSDLAPALTTILGYVTKIGQALTISPAYRKAVEQAVMGHPFGAALTLAEGGLAGRGAQTASVVASSLFQLPRNLLTLGGGASTTHVENNVEVNMHGTGRTRDDARTAGQEITRQINRAYTGSPAAATNVTR